MRSKILLSVWLGLTISGWALATDQPLEELPPPQPEARQEKSVLVDRDSAPSAPAPEGWGLTGPQGRFYGVGTVALADYVQGGRRYIAQLAEEDPALHAATAESFLYFRETVAGHRWAIARYPSPDQRYRVYFQAADGAGGWQLFQRAHATFALQASNESTVVWSWSEATCGMDKRLPFLSGQ